MPDTVNLTQRHLADHHGEPMVMALGCPLCAEEMAAQFDMPTESVMRSMLQLRGETAPGCPHCPDGHSDPTTRPWAVWVGSERDGDGQPVSLRVAPTNGAHVAESDAQWLRQVIRDAKAAR